jgi:putative sigma-54 modulation protein
MNVEYTGRQYEVKHAVRKQVEHSLAKLQKILGSNFDTHVVLAAEKHRHIAEITITVRDHSIVGLAQANDMTAAVTEALDRIHRQAVKYKARWRTRKRHPRKRAPHKWPSPAKEEEGGAGARETAVSARAVLVHSFPPRVRAPEVHVVRAENAVALSPLTLEEAIKEAEFRDRDVFVFRDPQGRVKVLHRMKDGKMELIEAP